MFSKISKVFFHSDIETLLLLMDYFNGSYYKISTENKIASLREEKGASLR